MTAPMDPDRYGGPRSRPAVSSARSGVEATAGYVASQAAAFLVSLIGGLDDTQREQLETVLGFVFVFAVPWIASEIRNAGAGGGAPPRSTLGVSIVLALALTLPGCVSWDAPQARALALEWRAADELSAAECPAFDAASQALEPRNGTDGPTRTWKGPLGYAEELERASNAQRLLAMVCRRAVDPTTPNVPRGDLAAAFSDAWELVLELTESR